MKMILSFIVASILYIPASAQNELLHDSLSVFFAYRKADPLVSKNVFDSLLNMKNSITRIELKGYTDSLGEQRDNYQLASLRLQATQRLLEEIGLGGIAIEQFNYNEQEGTKLSKLEENRRVDILVYTSKSGLFASSKEPELGKPINLQINFEGGTANFLPNSYSNLELLFQCMKKDSTLIVDLSGHVCCASNYNLSVQRANSVMNYLYRKGIAANRMTAKGFSNSKPIVPDTSEENMSLNRRVEAVFRR